MLEPMPWLARMLVLLLVSCTRSKETTAPATADPQQPFASADARATPIEPASASPRDADTRGELEGTPEQRAWDGTHLDRMLGYWRDLACFRARVRAAGEQARGSQPGSLPDEVWYQFKVAYMGEVDGW